MVKICNKCGKAKDADKFPKGRNYCKKCKNQYDKKYKDDYRKSHPEYYKAYRLEWHEQNPNYGHEWYVKNIDRVQERNQNNREYNREKLVEWQKRNPEYHRVMTKANKLAKYYFRKLAIQRPECQVCGDADTIMHHPDCSKPTEVVFVCRTCHRRIHHNKLNCPKPCDLKYFSDIDKTAKV